MYGASLMSRIVHSLPRSLATGLLTGAALPLMTTVRPSGAAEAFGYDGLGNWMILLSAKELRRE